MSSGYRQTCITCGGDGFTYNDRGVPSICCGCGGRGSTPGPVFPNPKRGRTVRTDEPAEADEFPVIVYDTGEKEEK